MQTSKLKLKLIKGIEIIEKQNDSFAWTNLYNSIIKEYNSIKSHFVYEVKIIENKKGDIIDALLMTNLFCGYILSCTHAKRECYAN